MQVCHHGQRAIAIVTVKMVSEAASLKVDVMEEEIRERKEES
jgi:hypothetical protein